jgi:hypothetical protein
MQNAQSRQIAANKKKQAYETNHYAVVTYFQAIA